LQNSVGSRAFQNARLQKQFKKQAEVLLPAAAAAYRQGKHSDAQALCRQILKDLPEHFDALHLLGVSELDCRQFEEAERTLTRAVSVDPRSAEARSNLGLALFNLRRYDDARKCQERAVALKPNFPMAWTNLGNALMRLELPEQAVAAHDRAIQLKPDYGDAYCNRGMALLMLNRVDQADQSFDRALSFQRRHLQAMFGKGVASLRLRHCDAAHAAFNAVLAIKPDFAEVLAYRGRAHQQMGQFLQAEADFDAALAIDPVMEGAWRGKAGIKVLMGDNVSATAACMKALEQDPASVIAITLLGTCYAQQRDIVTAIEHYDRALAIAPDYEEALVKKIFALDFAPDADFTVHQAARRAWWDTIGVKVSRKEQQRSMPDPNKRIVVGYVSSDFRFHSAALAFRPVLRNHDRRAFEIICYSCSPLNDEVTEECRSLADSWVEAAQFSDDELADRIRSDGVDILVDLSGHTAGNRLTVFARKPAPIQVTAWGAGTGTGLQTMDYFFADAVTIPETARHLFAEKVYDLPCVITTEALPDVQPSPLPMIRNGHVTFGVFNRIDKISDGALAMWSKLLRDIAGSTIVIKNTADQFLRDGLVGRFVAHEVAPDRVRCIGTTSRPEHIAEFANIDISLDPFPLNGGVSTWESLQAGVPVVTKLGGSAPSRLGGAIVKAVGLDDWVAEDDDGYHAIARKYASMASHLEALRAALPARVAASAAGNGAIYTRRVEEGYRQFWRDYCAAVSRPADRTLD
jgi:predicted O-linked N-acetylglucosamine transferase (SPINDLY family)